jgi:hypothetical protein
MYNREQNLQRNLERAAKQVQSLVPKSLFTKKKPANTITAAQNPSPIQVLPLHPSPWRKKEEEEARFYPQLQQLQQAHPPKKMELQHKNKGKRKTKSGNCDPNNTNPRGVELLQLLSLPKIRSTPKQKQQQLQSSSASSQEAQFGDGSDWHYNCSS